jgi:cell division protease FtsH
MTPLQQYTADHIRLLAAVSDAAGIDDPIAVDLDDFMPPLVGHSTRGPVVPLEGLLIRDWDRDNRRYWTGLQFGARVYTINGIRYARVAASCHEDMPHAGFNFCAVARKDYRRLYRWAVWCRNQENKPEPPPVLTGETFDALRRNTVDYLDRTNLDRIRWFGGRPKRGLLLTGPPGNGKTSACRWVRQQCDERGLEHKIITPDDYRTARQGCDAAAAVKALFQVERAGVVFFDDMDMALRDRAKSENPEDQAVFLGALDGIEVTTGAAYVFTTNLSPDLIDPAFRRPGRIDAVLHLPKQDAALRRKLVDRWHPDIRAAVSTDAVVADTEGKSFAEVEELKNLLILRFTEVGTWDWSWAKAKFQSNRDSLAGGSSRPKQTGEVWQPRR